MKVKDLKAKDLYKKILRICQQNAPKGQEQEYRFWLAYHSKNLILLQKDSTISDFLIKNGYKQIDSIKSIWSMVQEKGIVRKNPRFKFGDDSYKSWLPGMATKQWLQRISK